MKDLFIFILILSSVFGLLSSDARAVSPTTISPSPPPKPASLISDLKERIASRVAELKLVEKRGIIGKVTDVTLAQITVADLHDNTRFVDVDEFTKFSSPSASPPAGGSFGISDISRRTTLGITGLHNKQSRRLLARFVEPVHPFVAIHGAVAQVNTKDFTVRVTTPDAKSFTVDVGTTTKTQSYAKDTGLVRSGFSKIVLGQRILVIGYEEAKDATRIIASRMLLFAEIPPHPNIRISLPTPTLPPSLIATPSPTVTPTKKASTP